MTWHCPLVSWWLARPPCAIKRTPLPRGRGLAGGCQTMHSPAWIEARTLRLPGDTAPVELNAHPRVCMIQCTKSVRLTFPVTDGKRMNIFTCIFRQSTLYYIITQWRTYRCATNNTTMDRRFSSVFLILSGIHFIRWRCCFLSWRPYVFSSFYFPNFL